MLYGTLQAGGVITTVGPSDQLTLFSGTEAPSSGIKSVAFARGYNPGAGESVVTFYVSGLGASNVVEIEGSNTDVDGDYFVLSTITPDANGNGAYSDSGQALYYRAVLSTYVSGGMPVVTVQR